MRRRSLQALHASVLSHVGVEFANHPADIPLIRKTEVTVVSDDNVFMNGNSGVI